ncbi:unnamed protein product [Lupinus luteus]|uniref:Fiber protein Fb34 n=1 Tax=Lupinus luteus TaxID=3873 RepID=A0AAV1X189_LUPLU
MAEGRGSTLVHLLVVVLSLVAFVFAIAAERRTTFGTMFKDEIKNETYCVYNSDVASGYGVGAFLFLLASESLLMGVTKCMCFGRSPLTPGANRAWAIIYFISSWVCFLVAEACFVGGVLKNSYHTKYRGMIYAQNFLCEILRKGVFVAGAIFVVATMVLNVYYYVYYTRASTATFQKGNQWVRSTICMTGYP